MSSFSESLNLNADAPSFVPLNADAAPFVPLNAEAEPFVPFIGGGGGQYDAFIFQVVRVSRVCACGRCTLYPRTPGVPVAVIKAKEGEDACVVCFDNVPNCKFVDCDHGGFLCSICADKLLSQRGARCPLCRGNITKFTLVSRPRSKGLTLH